VYDMQAAGRAFDTPRAWLEALGLWNATQQSAADYMAVRGARAARALRCWLCTRCVCCAHV
jgi:hypothetical protein